MMYFLIFVLLVSSVSVAGVHYQTLHKMDRAKKNLRNSLDYLRSHNGGEMIVLPSTNSDTFGFYREVWNKMIVAEKIVNPPEHASLTKTEYGISMMMKVRKN